MIALASLSESARKIALDRFRLLQPHLEEKRPLKAVARDAGIRYRTAQRWVMRYRKCDLAGLARNDRVDRRHRRIITPALAEILEALALQKPPMPIAALHRHLCRIAVERGQPVPSYKAVYRVRHLPADLVMLANKGSKAYRDAFELVHRREADRPNAIWQADHTLLDIMLARDGTKAAKPWLTVDLSKT
jgi:putative transposase